ncbi:MAG: phosphoribosylformylglycinamidine synthase subunit PurL [Nitrospirae bacterium]|nr:phosphoribosylformylglycinamidine synthase subunit PurL [Nitrospirota bacterium]
MKEPEITKELIKDHGITDEEYSRIIEILGRKPSFTELGIFSVMWSEHCSYKSSRLHLRNFPTKAKWVIQGPGENAGVIDIGDDIAAIFKIESHNHPSYIEPYQGAATGVGGILRDVFTMGARPVASLNSLRFGELSDPYQRHLFGGVVSGIAGYGNCMGVPTIGGEISAHPCYNGNILVNVFNLGLSKKDKIFYGSAAGVGNHVIYVGAKTGKDGIHGVTMASEEFTDDAEQKKPTVQVGDPFTEKLLLEACLEAMKKELIVGIQDMGGAGLTSSSSEMAGRAGTGVELELSEVPLRESDMIPYEIMLSESQERMLLVCTDGKKDELIDIFKKWELDATVIGRVTNDGKLRIKWHGNTVAEIEASKISDKAPLYDRPSKKPDYQDDLNKLDISTIPEPNDYNEVFLRILSLPSIASKSLVWEQYDHMVRTNTVQLPGTSAGVIRIKATTKALAMSVDCNSRYCYLDPYLGGMHAVAEAARNVACTGAVPMAVTNCLNFGNPEKPEVMWQLKNAIIGIAEACTELNTPVISGNVSLYNETKGSAIFPTPVIGVVGMIEDVSNVISHSFKSGGDKIILIGDTLNELGGSDYLALIHSKEMGVPPALNLKKERALHELLAELSNDKLVNSAQDCSDGGLMAAMAECCIDKGFGASIDLSALASGIRTDALLFGESASRVVVSCDEKDVVKVSEKVINKGLTFNIIGTVVKDGRFTVIINNRSVIDLGVSRLLDVYSNSLANALK